MEARRRQSQEIGPTRCVRAWGNRSPCFTCAFPPLHTPAPCMFEAAVTSQHTEGLGVATQFHFFFFWQMTPWQLEKCWGPWTDFSVTKIKCVGVDKDRHFAFYFWTPMRALTNATPPPLRLCHDCFFFLSRNVINLRGDKSIWHKQTPASSKCT